MERPQKILDFPYLENKQRQNNEFFGYRHAKYDKDGFADASKYLPSNGDLVLMKLDDGRTINGWCWGSIWEGVNLKKSNKVLSWKKIPEDNLCH